jgi:branched-chain amino acid transport system permease protein
MSAGAGSVPVAERPVAQPDATTGSGRGPLRPAPTAGVAALAGLALVVAVLPAAAGDYVVSLATLAAIWAIVNMAWNLLLGYGGVFSLGQLGFFGIGAYGAAWMHLHTGLPVPLTIACAVAMGALAGLAVGWPSLRLFGPYMVLFTLAFQLSGGAGLQGLAPLGLFGASTEASALWVCGALAIAVAALCAGLLRSPFGMAIQALRDSRRTAEARGMAFVGHRVVLFVISAALTALAGALYAHVIGLVVPTVLDLPLLLALLAMLILGGPGTLAGPIVGAVILTFVNDRLSSTEEYQQVIWGATIIAVTLLLPGGIAGTAGKIRRHGAGWLDRWMDDGSEDAPGDGRAAERPGGERRGA